VNRWLSFEQRAINPLGETRVIIYALSPSPPRGRDPPRDLRACVLRDKRNRRYDQSRAAESRFRCSRNRGSAIPAYRTIP